MSSDVERARELASQGAAQLARWGWALRLADEGKRRRQWRRIIECAGQLPLWTTTEEEDKSYGKLH